jgi:H(+)-translocating pyrophosphatase
MMNSGSGDIRARGAPARGPAASGFQYAPQPGGGNAADPNAATAAGGYGYSDGGGGQQQQQQQYQQQQPPGMSYGGGGGNNGGYGQQQQQQQQQAPSPSYNNNNNNSYGNNSNNSSMSGGGGVEAGMGSGGSGGGMYIDAKHHNSGATKADNQRSLRIFDSCMAMCIIACAVLSFIAIVMLGSAGGCWYLTFVLAVTAGTFAFCMKLNRYIIGRDDQNPQMQSIASFIREGSEGFLQIQYTAIAYMAVIVGGGVFVVYLFRESPSRSVSRVTLAILTAISFFIGAFCSATAGYIGVWVSVRVNLRVALAAAKYQYREALLLSFRGGAVSSALSGGLVVLGLVALYEAVYIVLVLMMGVESKFVPMLLAGYGFGASFVALFMQLGGGIYTKAADVGADMVGKIEQNIPEDDPRNPAVIADLVGDNVGDCAGSMADVFESIAAEMIGTMILGSTLAHSSKMGDATIGYVFFPLVVHACDLLVSCIGIWNVDPKNDQEDALVSMKRGYTFAALTAVVCFMLTCRVMLYTDVAPSAWWYFGLCGLVGISASYMLVIVTQYYTDYVHAPVASIAEASKTGHGTNIIAGIGVGMESTCLPVIFIAASLMCSYYLGKNSGLPGHAAGIYGTAVATMGMLCTAVFILSMNNFGPIADNAGGIVEMSGQPESVRAITDRLDAVGNVTKAATKGYAVGGSALACFVLFQAFLDETSEFTGTVFDSVNAAKIEVFCGGLLGVMMIFLFTGWSMKAVGRTAQEVVWEVRRQFKDMPGIMEGTVKPQYGQCVKIVTKAALREMRAPALLALGAPVVIGFSARYLGEATGRPMLGVEVAAGFLLFGSLTGLVMAIFLDNAGGAWDNAKKLIESQGLKGTEMHKAAVTGDTVGDPFKDTAGPALHVIITTMSTTILVLGPLFIGSSVVLQQSN